jgi:predicted dienelactone hydrolase
MPRTPSIVTKLAVSIALAACGGDDGPTDPPVQDIAGCDGATLLSKPTDPAARGPWPVGARTVSVGRLGKVEVWYPAARGSEVGKATARYDIREALNASQRTTISDADNPWQDCDCYRDLPLDDAHGPYPAVVFVHGTAAFRHQSLPIVTHWASRGFIVIAADHPGLVLGDVLTMLCPDTPTGSRDLAGDIAAEIAALGAPADGLAFLAGHVDATRLAVAGHSAGASAAASATALPGVRVVIGMAGNQAAADSRPTLERVLFMAGDMDSIVQPSAVKNAWSMSATPRHYFSIVGGAHLAFSDLCETKNAAGKDLLQVANDYNLCGAAAAGLLFQCDPAFIPGPEAWDIIDFATTTVLESTLQCATGGPTIDQVDDTYPKAHNYEEAL